MESLATAARIVEETVARDGLVYVFGSGHSQLAALELSRRAGSLAPLQVIFDPTWGAAEQLEGYGDTLVAGIAFGPADCLFVVSHSGVTPAPVEIAAARARPRPARRRRHLAGRLAVRPVAPFLRSQALPGRRCGPRQRDRRR